MSENKPCMLGIIEIRLIEEGIVTLNVSSIILRLCFQVG